MNSILEYEAWPDPSRSNQAICPRFILDFPMFRSSTISPPRLIFKDAELCYHRNLSGFRDVDVQVWTIGSKDSYGNHPPVRTWKTFSGQTRNSSLRPLEIRVKLFMSSVVTKEERKPVATVTGLTELCSSSGQVFRLKDSSAGRIFVWRKKWRWSRDTGRRRPTSSQAARGWWSNANCNRQNWAAN